MDIAGRSGWIDVSVPLHTGMVHWPGDPPVQIERTSDMARGDRATISKISMGAHTGTHMDAPVHFLRGERGIDAMPLDATNGPARVIRIRDAALIKPEELELHGMQPGERILFKTSNSERCWKTDRFVEDFVSISKDAAELLAERRIRTVGVDYLSVGGLQNGVEIHQSLLRAGIWIIEGLNLSSAAPGNYELVCLPLRVEGGDGAPARAMLRPL
jgi:arylformamidase